MSIFSTFIANFLWDRAMRKGKIILVASLSYFTPLLSIIISSLYLQVAVKANLWIARGLVIAGAVICKFSIIDKTPKESTFKQKLSFLFTELSVRLFFFCKKKDFKILWSIDIIGKI